MAFVRVEQRNAHLAGGVRLNSVEGRDGPISKATLTAISNTRKGSGDNRGEEATAIQWTLWGKQAEAAAQYLAKGSHVNVVGRVQNNNYERDGEPVYSMAFTAEEIDYLDTKAEGEAPDIVFKRGAQTSISTAQGNLEVAALLYWLEHDLFDQMAANETKVLTMRMPSVIQTAMPLTARYFFGVARSASYQSVSGDAQRVLTAAAGRDENARRQHLLATGLQGSAIEGSVLDQLYTRPEETSVSTTQYLAIAMRQGLKLFSVTSENINAVLPQLATSQAVKDDIVNAIAAGYVAFVPERDISHKGYTGIGYVLLDPGTGAGAYLIDGGRNGFNMPLCKSAAFAPGGFITVQALFNPEQLSRSLTGLADTAGATAEEQAAKRIAAEAIEKAARSSAQRVAQRAGPRLLVSLLALPPGVNVAIAVALAVAISIEIILLVMEIKLILEELKLATKTRTEEDTRCKCELSPSDPACKCQIQDEPQKPIRSARPQPEWTAYDRRVDWHHRCADNNSSFPGRDVRITTPTGASKSFDTYQTTARLACEVKTSFKNEPYSRDVLNRWRAAVASQLAAQRAVASQCEVAFCVIVNKPWLEAEVRALGYTDVRVQASCASAPPASPSPDELPTPPLDWD
jgi:hypothetical protein